MAGVWIRGQDCPVSVCVCVCVCASLCLSVCARVMRGGEGWGHWCFSRCIYLGRNGFRGRGRVVCRAMEGISSRHIRARKGNVVEGFLPCRRGGNHSIH